MSDTGNPLEKRYVAPARRGRRFGEETNNDGVLWFWNGEEWLCIDDGYRMVGKGWSERVGAYVSVWRRMIRYD